MQIQLKEKANHIHYGLPNSGGEGGIRTHVSVKTNAFRVRPVMTASILLHKYLNILSHILKKVKNSIYVNFAFEIIAYKMP